MQSLGLIVLKKFSSQNIQDKIAYEYAFHFEGPPKTLHANTLNDDGRGLYNVIKCCQKMQHVVQKYKVQNLERFN